MIRSSHIVTDSKNQSRLKGDGLPNVNKKYRRSLSTGARALIEPQRRSHGATRFSSPANGRGSQPPLHCDGTLHAATGRPRRPAMAPSVESYGPAPGFAAAERGRERETPSLTASEKKGERMTSVQPRPGRAGRCPPSPW